MSLFSRFRRRLMLCLLSMISGVCAAQQTTQFLNLPGVQLTGGRVTSFQTGVFQSPSGGTDILYVNAPVSSGGTSSVTAGIMLDGSGFTTLPENQITFPNTANVVEALGDYNGDGITDFAFAFVPQGSSNIDLCVYYGTGATVAQAAGGRSSFSGLTSISGCLVFPSNEAVPPVLSNMASFVRQTNGTRVAQLLLEDSANGVLYIIANNGMTGSNGNLQGYFMQVAILSDGAGPIYVGDFNGDGYTDFIINGQTGMSASAFISSVSNSFFVPSHIYTFDKGVRSMLMQDMDHDGVADMVVEGTDGSIEIHKGIGDGTFAAVSEGGTESTPGSAAGNGGRLAAINPQTLDILTTTPIGLSLLRPQSGTLTYALQTIYNIGPGRSSFELADFHVTGNLDLGVDSAEGVAIFTGNPDGTFVASQAYSALTPGLGAVVGKFRNAANNPTDNVDVVVATGAIQGQLLFGNGNGAFTAAVLPTDPLIGQMANPPPANLWSNVVTGDFNGDGNPDVVYSLTGLPIPAAGSGGGPGLYVQYGNGDGTFQAPVAVTSASAGAPGNNNFYGGSAAGDFNGDGIGDIANGDLTYSDTLLGERTGGPFRLGLNVPLSFNTNFEQVATGYFTKGRTGQQDVVFQRGQNLFPFKNAQNGTGTLNQMTALYGIQDSQYSTGALLLADVDGDGFGDVIAIYYNTVPDFANGGAAYRMFIYFGNGDGTFSSSPTIYSLSRNYYLAAVADMNGDGLPDLVLSDGTLISILYNQGNRSFGTLLASGLYTSEQHFLAGQGINSISLADVNGDGIPDLVAANGGATLSNAVAIGGRTLPSISLAANPADINTGGITVLINHITTQPVTGTLAASPEPTSQGQAFTMTATLTSSPGVAAPTGSVTFYLDGTTLISTSPLTEVAGSTTTSTATYTVAQGNTFAAGVHPMTAVYSGDTVNSQATIAGATGTHLIQSTGTTSYIFMCIGPTQACPAPPAFPIPVPVYTPTLSMYYGQIWNGFISVGANDGSALTGNLELVDTYTGAAAPPPTPLCSLPVAGGACPTGVGTTEGTSVGLNVLTAYYPGDATHSASTSNPVAVTVLPDTTSATLTGWPNPSPAQQPVTFTATVTGNFAAPTGPVTFTYGSTLLGQINLAPSPGYTSTAVLTTSILPVGSDVITATYGATTDFAGASATFTETITQPAVGGFTLSVTPATSSVGVGYSTLLVVTVTPHGGFSQGVNLSCAGLPNEATCFFDTQTLTTGAYTTNLVVNTTAPHSCGTSTPYFLGSNSGGTGIAPFALPAIAGLLAIFLPGRRRWMRALLAVIVVAGVTQMSGCGTCTDLGTRPATYTFQVWGAATGTSELETQPVTITVTI